MDHVRATREKAQTAHSFYRTTRGRSPRKSAVAVNKSVGDNCRKGAVEKRSLKTELTGEETWTKRSRAKIAAFLG